MNLDFSHLRILVAGEAGLDVYVEGTTTRQSPEAPAPVVSQVKRTEYLGMAANLCRNLDSLGAQSTLFTVNSPDCYSSEVTSIDVEDPDRPVIRKERIICDGKQLARVDYENTRLLTPVLEKRFLYILKRGLNLPLDGVIIQDYGKGLWTDHVLFGFIQKCVEKGIRVFVDPYRGREIEKYNGAYLIKPNLLEANMQTLTDYGMSLPGLVNKYHTQSTATVICLTTGQDGAHVIYPNYGTGYEHFPAVPTEPKDVTGAGDTFLATLACSILVGNGVADSVRLANKAASLSIQKPGPSTVTVEELK